MSDAVFSAPVTILVGLGFPCKIRSAKYALAYLDDRPASDRDEAWEATVAACRDALADRTKPGMCLRPMLADETSSWRIRCPASNVRSVAEGERDSPPLSHGTIHAVYGSSMRRIQACPKIYHARTSNAAPGTS